MPDQTPVTTNVPDVPESAPPTEETPQPEAQPESDAEASPAVEQPSLWDKTKAHFTGQPIPVPESDPLQQAQKDNYAYTGEKGAQDTRKLLLRGKSPEEALQEIIKEHEDIIRRTSYIAQEILKSKTPPKSK